MRFILALLALLAGSSAYAQGTLPLTLTQQFSFTGCATASNACGTPLAGGLLYFYQVGTVATRQNSFQDTGLTLQNPWPLILDANGRVPIFYLANGSVHIRLTDASGVVQFDIPSALVIGPSSGGGGGGSVDPTTIASTGDMKFRPTSESLSGWVKMNGQTIGSATSGATQRANADTQALFIYLWANCPNTHCPVSGGRGATGLADFTANKTLQLMDMRARTTAGLDDMGNAAAGILQSNNITSGGGDGPTTPNATGGEANHTQAFNEMAAHRHIIGFVDPGHAHTITDPGHTHTVQSSGVGGTGFVLAAGAGGIGVTTSSSTTGITVNGAFTGASVTDGFGNANLTNQAGNSLPFNNLSPAILGTWYQKL